MPVNFFGGRRSLTSQHSSFLCVNKPNETSSRVAFLIVSTGCISWKHTTLTYGVLGGQDFGRERERGGEVTAGEKGL